MRVKFFWDSGLNWGDKLEEDINRFLEKNEGKIQVIDIRFVPKIGRSDSDAAETYSVVILYEIK